MSFDKAIEIIEDRYKRIQATINWLKAHNLDVLSELSPEVNIYEDYASIDIPADNLAILCKIRKGMGKGWKQRRRAKWDNGKISLSYYHKDDNTRSVSFIITSEYSAKSCKLVQVGIKQMPVYEIVCQ